MKTTNQKFGSMAVAALLVFSVLIIIAACGAEDGVSPLGAPGISEVKSRYNVANVSSVEQAVTLLYNARFGMSAGYFSGAGYNEYEIYDSGTYTNPSLRGQLQRAVNRAQYNVDNQWNSIGDSDVIKSYDISVSINDTEEIKTIPGVTAGLLKGSYKNTWSSSLTYQKYAQANNNYNNIIYGYGNPVTGYEFQNGDSYSSSNIRDRRIEINNGFVSFGSYKAAGVIVSEYSYNQSRTWKDVANQSYSGSESNISKMAMALSIDNGTMGAVYRFTMASDGSSSRAVDGQSSYSYSNLEVYSKAGALLFTIPYNYSIQIETATDTYTFVSLSVLLDNLRNSFNF